MGRNQTGVDLPSPSCHIKFRECAEGSGPARHGDTKTNNRRSSVSSLISDVIAEAASRSDHEESSKHLYLTLFLLISHEEFLSYTCHVRVD